MPGQEKIKKKTRKPFFQKSAKGTTAKDHSKAHSVGPVGTTLTFQLFIASFLPVYLNNQLLSVSHVIE